MRKIKILVSDSTPLYPPAWGGAKRIWGLISGLSGELFEIDYLGIDFNVGSKYRIRRLSSNIREFIFPLPQSYKFWRFFEKRIIKNDLGFSLVSYFIPSRMRQFKSAFDVFSPDIIIISHPWVGRCVEKKKGNQLLIYDAHNCEYHLMQQLFSDENKNVKNFLLSKIKHIEGDMCKRSDVIFVCSDYDAEIFYQIYGVKKEKIYILPNGTEIRPPFVQKSKKIAKVQLGFNPDSTLITFVGSNYKPNIEAAEFIIQRLAPSLKKFIFIIGGSVGHSIKGKNLPENVCIFPNCDEEKLDRLLRATDIAINPIKKGSGTNIKILDYLSYQLPVISTSVGIRGLNFEHGKEVYISELSSFSNSIKELKSNYFLSAKLSFKGYSAVISRYTWFKISQELEELLLTLLDFPMKLRKKSSPQIYEGVEENLLAWANGEKAPPFRIDVHPTNRCNLRCLSCPERERRWAREIRELSAEQLLRIIDEGASLGVKEWQISGGGEPLIRGDVTLKMMAKIKSYGMRGALITNGTLITPEIVMFLINIKWENVVISLDGPNAEINDYLRPPSGTFKKVLKTLKLFKRFKKVYQTELPFIDIYCVLSKININYTFEMVKIAIDNGCKTLIFEPVKNFSGLCDNLMLEKVDYQKAKAQMAKAIELAEANNLVTNLKFLMEQGLINISGHADSFLNSMFPVSSKNNGHLFFNLPCYEPWYRMVVYVNGFIAPCCVVSGVADFKNKHLRDIWFGEEFERVRDAISKNQFLPECKNCGYIYHTEFIRKKLIQRDKQKMDCSKEKGVSFEG